MNNFVLSSFLLTLGCLYMGEIVVFVQDFARSFCYPTLSKHTRLRTLE